jgi:site-specific DNA recombinase
VTQQFNTTTSMGRLTLNVLLSFAQFEREVTGERIRDKIAASKKKGMWMGGMVPVGYDVAGRKLVVNPLEAAQVIHIYERYLASGCVSRLKAELDRDGIISKLRTSRNGKVSGGLSYSRGALYELLNNRLYLGEIRHRNQHYPGQHDAIVPVELWEKVQAKLTNNMQGKRSGLKAKEPSLLLGLVYDETGNRLTPSHTVKDGKRYRYYVSASGQVPKKRVPAKDLEQLFTSRIASFLMAEHAVLDELANQASVVELQALLRNARAWANTFVKSTPAEQRSFVQQTVEQILVKERCVDFILNREGLLAALLPYATTSNFQTSSTSQQIKHPPLTLTAHAKLMRCGLEMRLVVPGEESKQETPKVSQSLIKAIARGRNWYEQMTSRGGVSLGELAQASDVNDRYASRILRFAFLSPDIVEAILEGKQPKGMTLEKAFVDMPLSWEKQRQVFEL